MNWITSVCLFIRGLLVKQLVLAAENLALRQQLAVLHRSVPRPKLQDRDRRFWVWLCMLWSKWRTVLIIVSPETVIRWHRQGFRYYWRWKSRGKPGRPVVDAEVRRLIRRMSRENPLWGAPHSGRAAPPRARRRRVHCRQVHEAAPQTAIADVAVVPQEPRPLSGVR